MGWPEQSSAQAEAPSADFADMAADPVHDYALETEPAPAPLQMDVPEGVTPPTRRGVTRRPLLDAVVELGYPAADVIETVQRTGRVTGRPPEQILVEEGSITAD